MKLIRSLHNLNSSHHGCVATIGNFDGVHLGHQKILQQLIAKAKEFNLPSLVITFEPLPQEYFSAEKAPARLMKLREKIIALKEYGVDRVLCLRFNQKLASISAEEFVKTILVDKLGVRYLIIGDDFRFGHKRQGDFNLLQKMGMQFGFEVMPTETVLFNGERVGSSRVRNALAEGDLALAKQLLGRPYYLSGHVSYGEQLGRELGFPTANIFLHRKVLPLRGVFVVQVHGLGDKPLLGAANIGRRPTVDDEDFLLEVYILDFNQNIYGKFLQVEILRKLRGEEKFNSLEELKIQIAKDVEDTKKIYNAIIFS